MPTSKFALDFIEFCDTAPDARAIEDRFVQALQSLGYEHIACTSHTDPLNPRPGSVTILNYPMPWLEQYSQGQYAYIDPILLIARAVSGPFRWNEYLRRMQLNPQQRRVLADGASYGLASGMTVPLSTPDVMPASCSLVESSAGVDPLDLADTLIIVMYGHGAMHRRLNPQEFIDPVMLSPRERECLTLVASGKSDWVIGEVLNLSERTVHNSIERAKKRYGACCRAQAVVCAMFDGQIRVDDLAS